jgi:hypothetical protein
MVGNLTRSMESFLKKKNYTSIFKTIFILQFVGDGDGNRPQGVKIAGLV